jgi:hypothetical protein
MLVISVNDEVVYLFGGKLVEINNQLPKTYSIERYIVILKLRESDDLFELDSIMLTMNKRKYKKLFEDVKFSNHACVKHMNNIYIYNKSQFYSYDIVKDEVSLLKPLLFSPEPVKSVNLFICNNYLFAIGTMKHYDDCFIFKTQLDNLQPNSDTTKQLSYDVKLY